jgi:hypothetical protein
MRPANQTPVDRHHPPRGYGRDDPTNARWNNFRTAVRELIAAAEHETTTRQQAHKTRDAA